MNPDMFVYPDFVNLLNMENMNAGFLAEGLTSRKRTIARYMKTKGTKDDKKALKLLHDIGDIMATTINGKHPKAMLGADSSDLLEQLGRLVGEEDGRITRPEASPLALYAMALCALEPQFGLFEHDLGWDCLVEAVALGCDPAWGLYADMALRKPLSPEDADVRNSLQEFLEEALEAMNKNVFEARDEDLLLVTGRRFALCDTGETVLSYLVRKGLMILAKADHVDALRLLALDHAPDPSPETLWARNEIRSQAKRGRAHAMLIMGQHLSGSLFFWRPKGDREINQAAARCYLEKRARKNDPWATLVLAYTYLPWHALAESPEKLDEDGVVRENMNRALNMLETLAHEGNFAPAKATLGAWHSAINQDPETAWPLLRDACAQMFSRQCEAACADFLIGAIVNAMYVHAVRAGGAPRIEYFNDDDHGGPDFWLKECQSSAEDHERFGLITLALQRLVLSGDLSKDSEHPEEADNEPDANNANDVNAHPGFLTKSELDETGDCIRAIHYGGRLAVHAHLLGMTSKSLVTRVLSDPIVERIQADMADGNEDCIMADVLFMKRLFDADTWSATELEGKCVALAGGSHLARTALTILHIHMLVENAENGLGLDQELLEREMYVLDHEYMRAVQSIDLPVLCALPVLFKYARSQFSPKALRKSIEFVTECLFDGKRDLKGLVAEVNDVPFTWDLDMDLLWENLGLVPNIDFAPRAMTAGYETSAMRSRRSAQARKNARRKKDKLKKAERKKDRRRKR